jgi:hypothetical protein
MLGYSLSLVIAVPPGLWVWRQRSFASYGTFEQVLLSTRAESTPPSRRAVVYNTASNRDIR